jgi:hypothetical protein
VVFSIFQVAHSKLVSYVFPLFPALAILAADFIDRVMRQPKRLFAIISWISWLLLAFVPAAVIISEKKYAAYMPPMAIMYSFLILYVIVLIVLAWAILKRRVALVLTLLGLQVPFLLTFALSVHNNFDAYVSSKASCEYLASKHTITGTLLCAKSNVRGVRYYTGRNVAILSLGGGAFFSPHPIVYLTNESGVKQFLATQPLTYGILSKRAAHDLERIATAGGWKFEVLAVIGDKHIVLVRPA